MKIEILAPSGDNESLIAALNAGADAIYLGLSNFNARAKAANFSSESLRDTVKLIHLYGSKIYVTVNTLVKDSEYDEFIKLVRSAVEAKVDAFIIQDLGVARVLTKAFPGITLHASTQMGINNLNGALVAESLGIKRVILARETKLEDIKQIRQNTSLEIEYFIQGALCVSYSGNCYLSAFTTLNSGNRGKCAQLCRLKYTANGDSKYYLSARDLCLIKDLKELIDAGVTSFKIEGRLRHPGYVATSVATYKKAIKYLNENKKLNYDEEITKLKEAFSRGEYLYNAYLNDGVIDDAISTNYNNHAGRYIGKVISCSPFKDINELTIKSNYEIHVNDGLKFFNGDKEIGSIGVGSVKKVKEDTYKVYTKKKFINGAMVHLILNYQQEQDLLSKKKLIDLDLNVIAHVNKPLIIEFKYKNVKSLVKSDFILQEASNKPVSEEELVKQIDKFDTNPFKLRTIACDIGNIFIPKSIINETRRKAIDDIKEKIILAAEKDNLTTIDENFINSYKDEEVSFDYDKSIIIVDSKADLSTLEDKDKYLFVIYEAKLTYDNLVNRVEELRKCGIKNIGIYQNLIMLGKDQLLLENVFAKYPFLVLLGNNVSCLSFINKGYKVIPSVNLNIFSKQSLLMYKELGALNVVASLECNVDFLNEHEDVYSYVVGYNTLMNFAHCPYKTVKGSNASCNKCAYNPNLKYNDYKIRRYQASLCQFELLNDKVINTFNDVNNKKLIDLRNLSKQEQLNVFEALNNGTRLLVNNNETSGLIYKEVK